MAEHAKRMHAVAVGYLEAFAARLPRRRHPAIWRFDRATGESKLLGIRDAEVVKGLYAVAGDDGTPDMIIERTVLANIEGEFCTALRLLIEDRGRISASQFAALAYFLVAQLLRTPRAFQLVRDELAANGVAFEPDTPQKLMVLTIRPMTDWIYRMGWVIAHNDTGVPFITCDNPVSMWKKCGDGFESGVGFRDPKLHISCPLTPHITLVMAHTQDSLKRVLAEPIEDPLHRDIKPRISAGELPSFEVKRLNLITVANAHQYVYASYKDAALQRFLSNRFFGRLGTVRRRDLKPIGSPVQAPESSKFGISGRVRSRPSPTSRP